MIMKTKNRYFFLLAVLMMGIATMITGCVKEDIASNDNGGGTNPTDMNVDELNVKVTADVPTAVMSSFDDNSMGAAIVRRLSNTTTSVNDNTKMVLIKGEDILNRPFTEWMQAAKIYLRGGYIAIEKPHDAHLVSMMEQIATKMAQAEDELLTEDNGNGITITITPYNGASAPSNVSSAQVARFKSRIANIQAKARHRAADDQQPVAEMVIFARDGYYHCAPFQYSTVYLTIQDKDGSRKIDGSTTVTNEYTRYALGLKADGAAEWLNSRQQSLAERRAQSRRMANRANGSDAINDLMSASEEYTYQTALMARGWETEWKFNQKNPRPKPDAYKQIYRIWGAHNMDTNKDYYLVQQHTTASVGGKQEGDARFDTSKTLYEGPYEANKWYGTTMSAYDIDADNKIYMTHWYGAWFDAADYAMNLTGTGEVKIEEAVPTTDNNDASATVTVGEYKEETTNIGGSVAPIITTKEAGVRPSVSYSHGYTNGTIYTMGYTSSTKELKVQKNTDGSKVTWNYAIGVNVLEGEGEEHQLAPDALTSDVDMMNQVCWSVANPEGAYTLNIEDHHAMAALASNGGDFLYKYIYKDDSTDGTATYTLASPNRAQQTWRMDVDFPEIGQPGHEGQKGQLTNYLKEQFPDLYQPTIVLADQTPDSENTIKNLVNTSKDMLSDENALQTLKGYALDLGISQFTIKWYCTEGKHNTYDMTVKAK